MRKRHNDIPVTQIPPSKIARHEPIQNIIDQNEQFLQDIEQQEIQNMLEQNTQVGFGITQITPADENIHQELRQFFRDEQPWDTDRNLRQVYIQNFGCIRLILKPSTVIPIFSSDIYAMIVLHSLNPLPKPLKICFSVKPMLSRSTFLFHSFYNTERLGSSNTIIPATTIKY